MKYIGISLLALILSLPSLAFAEAGEFRIWPMPGGRDSRPCGTALDASGMLWIAETGPYPNRLIGFDTKRQAFVSDSEVSSGGAIRHMYYDAKSGAFWFGVDSGYLDRARRITREN